jgi:hypothetical protein
MAVFASISTLLNMNACTTEKIKRREVVSKELVQMGMVEKKPRYFEGWCLI